MFVRWPWARAASGQMERVRRRRDRSPPHSLAPAKGPASAARAGIWQQQGSNSDLNSELEGIGQMIYRSATKSPF
eukprot:CAMPEP_0174382816 /NCGR_PEP_ID=MMETSP0811_2-20130205/124826_1 /TAXON_ID=73025 ORGANISM="Eutreptiella gymnastica-like, Strain CCMP1594" /NCGR_SAMPLE_ID=MMETSP0811_2 /ASSEMBLY_ACC=CAM_ASM_000667 /LENGTH=74 /DNA_ID=CAMNT_0015536207 /DNA_START=575 /DNA_END=799 /DNA_ORIENTATION=+